QYLSAVVPFLRWAVQPASAKEGRLWGKNEGKRLPECYWLARRPSGRTGACRPVVCTPRLRRSRPMRPKEGTNLAYRQGNPLLGLLPRKDAHFRVRREHRGLHGHGVRMRRDI